MLLAAVARATQEQHQILKHELSSVFPSIANPASNHETYKFFKMVETKVCFLASSSSSGLHLAVRLLLDYSRPNTIHQKGVWRMKIVSPYIYETFPDKKCCEA